MTIRVPEDKYVNAGEVKTRFWNFGDRGPVVILLHGLGASAEVWLHNVELLAKNHRIFIPDLAGFGRSERPPPSFSPLDYVSFLDDFMDALHIERASLVGQSLGGAIALKYALQFPHKVEKLVLADCGGFGQEVIWTLKLMSLPWIGEIVSYPTRAGVTLFFKLAVRNPAVITKEFIDHYYNLFTQPGFQAFLLKIVRMLVDYRGAKHEILAPVMENLHRIKQPTLIIWGENDRVFPLKHASFGKERMPNAQLHIMKMCGHIPNLERPEEFNNVVIEFLDG
jgi:4,5:9,10-diseco-3-hydroxy-5,9,17-trioxoandrosta-1(10),2-diene-4-oate hydrolase